MISVVIPLYNKEAHISEAVESVLEQTCGDFELIIVDDGSTDDSAEIVKSFKDERIQLTSIEHSGVAVARNTGIQHANRDYIAFLDADDWWAPEFLEEMKRLAEQYPGERVFAAGRTLVYPKKSHTYQNRILPPNGETARIDYWEAIATGPPPVNASNALFSRRLFKASNDFTDGMQRYEDHDLWARLCMDYEVVFYNRPLSFYRKRDPKEYQRTLTSKDLLTYISTLRGIYTILPADRRKFMKRYFRRFILPTYLRYYSTFDTYERQRVILAIRDLTPASYRIGFRLLNIIPFSVYPFLRWLR